MYLEPRLYTAVEVRADAIIEMCERVRAEALRDAAKWLAAIRSRLLQGPATSTELAEVCGCEVRGPFGPFLHELLKLATLTVRTEGAQILWELK